MRLSGVNNSVCAAAVVAVVAAAMTAVAGPGASEPAGAGAAGERSPGGLAGALSALEAMAGDGGDRSALWGVVGAGRAEAMRSRAAAGLAALGVGAVGAGELDSVRGAEPADFAGALTLGRLLALRGALLPEGDESRARHARAARRVLVRIDGAGVSTAGEALRRLTLAWALANESTPAALAPGGSDERARLDAVTLLESVLELPVGADPSRTVPMSLRVEAMMGLVSLAATPEAAKSAHAAWALELDAPAARAADPLGAELLAEALGSRLVGRWSGDRAAGGAGGAGGAGARLEPARVRAACAGLILRAAPGNEAGEKLLALTGELPTSALPREAAALRARGLLAGGAAAEGVGERVWEAARQGLAPEAGTVGEPPAWVAIESVRAGARVGAGVRRADSTAEGVSSVRRFVEAAAAWGARPPEPRDAGIDGAMAAALDDLWWLMSSGAGGVAGVEVDGSGKWALGVLGAAEAALRRSGAGAMPLLARAAAPERLMGWIGGGGGLRPALSLALAGVEEGRGEAGVKAWLTLSVGAVLAAGAERRGAVVGEAWELGERVSGSGEVSGVWDRRLLLARALAGAGGGGEREKAGRLGAEEVLRRLVAEGGAGRWGGVPRARVELASLLAGRGEAGEAMSQFRAVADPWEEQPASRVRPAEVWEAWAGMLELLAADNADGRRSSTIGVRVRALRAVDPGLGGGSAARRIEAVERGLPSAGERR